LLNFKKKNSMTKPTYPLIADLNLQLPPTDPNPDQLLLPTHLHHHPQIPTPDHHKLEPPQSNASPQLNSKTVANAASAITAMNGFNPVIVAATYFTS
jgi:hypothetical protein